MKLDLNKILPLVDTKYISIQKHPTEELFIYNYTQKCQFDRVWTEETLMCRGIIVDKEGNILAKPFNKFFNYEEHVGEDSKLPQLPLEDFEVFDKLDGSLGILYWIGDTPHIATRGSFTSDQAIKATQILHNKYKNVKLYPGVTYLFEIIYPENRIVVDYGPMEDLYLLAAIDTETGKEMVYEWLKECHGADFPIISRYDGITDLTKIKELGKENSEGFVIKFKNGIRTKIKLEEYVRLHRLVTGVNAKTIWEHLKDGTGIEEIIDRVPDEFYHWVKKTHGSLLQQYLDIEANATRDYGMVRNMDTRKEQAIFLQTNSNYAGVVFKMLDEQPYDQIIWKLIRPEATRPYKEDIDA